MLARTYRDFRAYDAAIACLRGAECPSEHEDHFPEFRANGIAWDTTGALDLDELQGGERAPAETRARDVAAFLGVGETPLGEEQDFLAVPGHKDESARFAPAGEVEEVGLLEEVTAQVAALVFGGASQQNGFSLQFLAQQGAALMILPKWDGGW